MSGVIPKRSASGRKQWTLHGTAHSSINRLRNQLANDGCPESQVVLAKQLLNDEQEQNERHENAILGVYWLMKASQQGNVEATELLGQCLISGKGISEQNYLDVQSCIAMTQDEKLARRAAREMFASLSNGSDYVTTGQLQRKMLEIDKEKERASYLGNYEDQCNGELSHLISDEDTDDCDQEISWFQRSEHSEAQNEKLTEDHLIEAAVHYSNGQLPPVNHVLSLSMPDIHAVSHIPYVHRSMLHPWLCLQIIYYKMILLISSATFKFLNILKSDFQIVYLMLIYTLVSTSNLLYSVPIIAYCGSVIVMIITTFKMLQTKREFYDFRVWSGLFLTYSRGTLNYQQAEYQFIKKNMKPYLQFFLALLVNFFVYPIIAEVNIPQSELTIVSVCITFMTLFGFMYKKRLRTIIDYWALLSFCVNVLAKYPYEADTVVTQGWRYLDLKIPTLASYIIGNGIDFCINFRSVLYAGIPVMFGIIARRENWQGIYKYLIPHCVTLSWFQMAVISSQGATTYGLIRGMLALVGVVMFVPLVGLTTIVLPAAALSKWLMALLTLPSPETWYILCMFLLLFGMILSMCCIIARSRFSSYTSQIQILLAILALYYFTDHALQERSAHPTAAMEHQLQKTMSYDGYHKLCNENTWRQSNYARAQIRCGRLEGVPIAWEGYVHQVRIASTTNNYKYFINWLPEGLRQHMICYFGDELKPDCNDLLGPDKSEDCLRFYDVVHATHGKCHLNRHDVYVFEIIVKMHSGIWGTDADVHLTTGAGELKQFAFKLSREDRIWFKGTLERPGNGIIQVRVTELGCTTCKDESLLLARSKAEGDVFCYETVLKFIKLGLVTTLNCIFAPLLVFK